jgi:lipopolysaccharide transport system ATP-binding protein
MYVRLAFAVAAHLSSEILLVDEVLAVGDAAFQKRSIGMMREAADSGRTVIFVSHQMSAVAALCDRLIVLDAGQIRFMGETHAGIEAYMDSYAAAPDGFDSAQRAGGGEWRVTEATPSKLAFLAHEPKTFEFTARRHTGEPTGFWASANITDEAGAVVARCDSRLSGILLTPGASEASFRVDVRSPWLRPGTYHVDLYLENYGLYDHWERACSFDVLPALPYQHTADDGAISGAPVLTDFDFELISRADDARFLA